MLLDALVPLPRATLQPPPADTLIIHAPTLKFILTQLLYLPQACRVRPA
jgi:hypothetical protein